MHRSGTSVLTGALTLCGARVGADEDLTAATPDNPKGFWERRDMRALCNRLLRASGAEWWRVADLDLDATPPEVLAEARAAWASITASLGIGFRAVKEPRLCLLLPLLRPQTEGAVCLHIHRHPLEVARSLAARNDFGIAEGLALWEAYTRHALAASAGLPRLGLLHADLMADPAAALGRLGADLAGLGLAGFTLAPPDVLRDFVSVGLQHQRVTPGEAAAFLSPAQTALWAELLADPVPEVDAGLSLAARQILRDLDARKTAKDTLTVAEKRVAHLAGHTEKLEAELIAHKETLARREDALTRQKEKNAAMLEARARLQDALARQKEKNAALLEARARLQDEVAALAADVKHLNWKARKLRQAFTAATTERDRLRKEQRGMRKSTSWRITAPLRAIGDTAKRLKGRAGPGLVRRDNLATRIAHNENVAKLLRRIERARTLRLLRASPLFDADWYRAQNPDVAEAGIDPLEHFLDRGARGGRAPSAGFDVTAYLTAHPDIARAGLNPLVHYLRQGQRKGWAIYPATPKLPASDQIFDPARARAWEADLRADPAHARALATASLVSIILPTRDRVALLPAAIDSILTQSYPHWELIVVDDGSTDGTAAMVAERFPDPRICVVPSGGLGVSGARNAGLAVASGAFVAYLDSDNAWAPTYLELMLAEFERSGAASAYAVLEVRADAENGAWHRATPFDFESLKYANYIDLNVFMHRMDLFHAHGGFDTGLKRAVDWDLILRYVKSDPVTFAYFVGAEYDHSDRDDRLTVKELFTFKNVVRNKHWIDWAAETVRLPERNPDLVSVVICAQNPIEDVERSLDALFTHPAGMDFEVIIVENSGDAATSAIIADWAARHPRIRIVSSRENVHLALSSNLGFAASNGARVVFLRDTVEVAPEWLHILTRPLDDPAVRGTGPKVVTPEGAITAVGFVFPGPLPQPRHAGEPGDTDATSIPADVPALGGACLAVRAADFAAVRGFYPIYSAEAYDADLCLAIGGGAPVFRVLPDLVVCEHPARRHIRAARVESDRRQFLERWKGRLPAAPEPAPESGADPAAPALRPDRPEWVAEGLAILVPDRRRLPVPSWARGGHQVAIKIGCPRPEVKDAWGDYHFAVALAAAFRRKGMGARIDFAAEPDLHVRAGDINLVLRGRQRFEPKRGAINLMWLISHPDRPTAKEMRGFDAVFVASEVWTRKLLADSPTLPVCTLLQCTDAARFHPVPPEPALASPALFVANSRNVLRTVVRAAVDEDFPIDIWGGQWDGLAPAEWIRGENLRNIDLPRYYASAGAVLNDHWDSMRENGFISNRVFDVLACAGTLVTDRVEGFPEDIAAKVHFFGDGISLGEAVNAARADHAARHGLALEVAATVRREHSFDARADVILDVIARQLGQSQSGSRLVG